LSQTAINSTVFYPQIACNMPSEAMNVNRETHALLRGLPSSISPRIPDHGWDQLMVKKIIQVYPRADFQLCTIHASGNFESEVREYDENEVD